MPLVFGPSTRFPARVEPHFKIITGLFRVTDERGGTRGIFKLAWRPTVQVDRDEAKSMRVKDPVVSARRRLKIAKRTSSVALPDAIRTRPPLRNGADTLSCVHEAPFPLQNAIVR